MDFLHNHGPVHPAPWPNHNSSLLVSHKETASSFLDGLPTSSLGSHPVSRSPTGAHDLGVFLDVDDASSTFGYMDDRPQPMSAVSGLQLFSGLHNRGTVATVVAAGVAVAWYGKVHLGRVVPKKKQEDEQGEDQGPQPFQVVMLTKGFRYLVSMDVLTTLVLLQSWGQECDLPLRSWLAGGIAMGVPLSMLVDLVVHLARPAHQVFRIRVTLLRGGDPVESAQIGGVELTDHKGYTFDSHIDTSDTMESGVYTVFLHEGPICLKSYKIVTAKASVPALDPLSWVLEAYSEENDTWEIIDQRENLPLPMARRESGPECTNLLHDLNATAAFRMGVLTEVFNHFCAMSWLLAGTRMVATEASCYHTAPWLWYYVDGNILFTWSALGVGTLVMLFGAIMSACPGGMGSSSRGRASASSSPSSPAPVRLHEQPRSESTNHEVRRPRVSLTERSSTRSSTRSSNRVVRWSAESEAVRGAQDATPF